MTVRILTGDCRAVLAGLADASVQCCVTSPPYYGLRDYGTGTWEGGDEGCNHQKVQDRVAAIASSTLGGGKKSTGHLQEGYGALCHRCGATRIDNQLGLEAAPDAYVAEMVSVFREVRRVLRDDGTLWLNIGDSYNNFRSQMGPGQAVHGRDKLNGKPDVLSRKRGVDGLKEKDLLGIPWMLAFALRADGWYLRSDIIWHKPNPMPESVTDRPTSAHEHVFLLSKSERYFYEAAAIAEAADLSRAGKLERSFSTSNPASTLRQDVGRAVMRTESRNARNVWTIATQPYSGAHFATMAPELAERCIKAGTKPGDMVLDPFGGAGTTALVADRLKRDCTLIELNAAYAVIAHNRLKDDGGLFSAVEAS